MPQGGLDHGESYLSAMKRELYEETSIKSVKVLKELDDFLSMNYQKIWLVLFGKESLEARDKNGLFQNL